MIRALIPGSFDPPSNGHLNLIERASTLFDEIHVVIAVNRDKTCFFETEERYRLMTELLTEYDNVSVHLWEKLIVDYAEKVGAQVIIRGVRALADFSYEFELAMTNKGLLPGIEILFMPTDPKYFVLRSSVIKEIAVLGGDVSNMVPKIVALALNRKLEGA
ncbi:MAG: pantetheine-phosphate adenylyltransferase [Spirochaetales bacterium]|nr:pantetheine-phosphate adenylyltransferase [Spirochaetales bacterium]